MPEQDKPKGITSYKIKLVVYERKNKSGINGTEL